MYVYVLLQNKEKLWKEVLSIFLSACQWSKFIPLRTQLA